MEKKLIFGQEVIPVLVKSESGTLAGEVSYYDFDRMIMDNAIDVIRKCLRDSVWVCEERMDGKVRRELKYFVNRDDGTLAATYWFRYESGEKTAKLEVSGDACYQGEQCYFRRRCADVY
ncbi:MAG TPA: hypothetical protein PLX18_11605 [Anaerohalosphaeraceae bacterium]|nr:hypothetical protein [Anaerohalosphaeraceae bacterium]HQG06797.1 hypothetical protein [Anaerohalosphaeraceae bacterium]HQI08488.1 hypothetical protein [Anaerohalosphaeraceae bacterium]HQJ68954.1 hypothetical protein [Anaerohalosphaeraceae bacterium]